MIIKNLKVTFNKEEVLRQIGCSTENDFYQEISEEYEEIIEKMHVLSEPVCLIEYTDLKDQTYIQNDEEYVGAYAVLYSIGRGISNYSTSCFETGDYVKGMLANAMADVALFALEKEIGPCLRQMCEQMGVGILRRIEAPQDVPMEIQKYIYEKTKAKELCGFGITTGYMFEPVKSNAILFVLTKDREQFVIRHDCCKCKNYTCKYRNVPDLELTVIESKERVVITLKDGQSVLDSLIQYDNSYSAVCGGTGKCGKCKIRVIEGKISTTNTDRQYFSEADLEKGMRLACKAYPTEPITFEVCFQKEDDFQVIAEYSAEMEPASPQKTENYGIAVDIGTTTIALQLIEVESKKVVRTYTTINHQRQFGADVISRIQSSVEGKRKQLQKSVVSDLLYGIQKLVSGIEENVRTIVISGNTTMIHLLMGYDCVGLGVYPFIPENIEKIEVAFEDVFDSQMLTANVVILPGISAFVGGDVVSGLYACDVVRKDEYSLLIDLGTNGEIALGNSQRILVTSTAAGPAFEGGNITYGVGSIEGAISNVSINNEKY